MAKIKLEDFGIWYDDRTGLIFDEEGECRSNIPYGTFLYKGKLYKYGTKVEIQAEYPQKGTFIATFKQDTEMKRTNILYDPIPIAKAREYYDGKPFKLDDAFIEDGGDKRRYPRLIDSDHGIVEIIKPVYYKFQSKTKVEPETPPPLTGYRTVANPRTTDPKQIIYHDHLYNCEVDREGNVVNWFEPLTFGYGKYVYTVGTRVIIKHRKYANDKYEYFVAYFDGNCFKLEGDPTHGFSSHSEIPNRRFKSGLISEYHIVKIIEPHYYRPTPRKVTAWDKFKANGGPMPVDTAAGTITYIAVMVIGTIFKARLWIWVFSTIVYLLWRYGYTNKK